MTRSGRTSRKLVLFFLAVSLSFRSCDSPDEPGIGERFAQRLRETPANQGRNIPDRWFVEAGEAFEFYSSEYQIDPELWSKQIEVESLFKVYACNTNSMARGLTQLTYIALVEYCLYNPGEWKVIFYYDFKGELMKDENGRLIVNKSSIYMPKVNLKVGGWLFRHLRKKYKGDEREALVAYCAGEGNLNVVRYVERNYRDVIYPPTPKIEVNTAAKLVALGFFLFFLLSVVNLVLAWRIRNGHRNSKRSP